MKSLIAPLTLGALLAAGTAWAGVRVGVYVAIAPPPPLVEHVVVAPAPGFVWIPGYYAWDGRAYSWVSGRYVIPPQGRRAWVRAHWQQDRRGWYFVEGHWR